ncbi:hypothetical protein ElyMa_004750300 [Elysia marginata]|uniref:Uncharacterized protein n=1 Tax=Elysia marginata TaxID=1093978 RepID=A0AAV4IF92_9GAST|nr:hypothetical protein ElyMa_004750300 [Elysia marginata]
MRRNPEKTNFTIFTFSTKIETVRLKIGKHLLLEEPSPTYLGVTFDKRLTWKSQTDKCQEREYFEQDTKEACWNTMGSRHDCIKGSMHWIYPLSPRIWRIRMKYNS